MLRTAVALLLLPFSLRAQAKFEYWPGTVYDPGIPTHRLVLGYDAGDRISSPEAIVRYLEALAAARPDRVKLRDYGRIDMRLNKKGEVYVIEANPNPWLASAAEFYMAAKKAGYSYIDMIEKIVDLARSRSAA